MAEARTAFQSVPVVDVSGLRSGDPALRRATAAELARVGREVGFLYVVGHGIPEATIEGLLDAARRLFALPAETKQRYYIGRSSNHRGYVPRGEERFYGYGDDLKEAFDTALDLPADDPDYLAGNRMLGPNVWPAEVEGFDRQVTAYYAAALDLGKTLIRGFALGLGLPEEAFAQHVTKPTTQLRLVHYPPIDSLPESERANVMGIGGHTDYECFTILLPTAPGLQVINGDGEWIEVPPIPGAFVINIGDMLEAWSNGAYVATSHRVRQVTEERYSFPMFFATDYDTVVAPHPDLVGPENPPRYPALSAGDHLVGQTMQTFGYLIDGLKDGSVQLPEGSRGLNEFGRFEQERKAG
ncbi:Isopenicillin N synthase [Tistlia consotensis]|uniref:Isopenicillin N synthase n=1 Tax=Tistlia consotensis USBA 355 TaxID=560819 RepID=A0A1Y6BYF7_9PROT|nr:2-oxoglutarate and iron-dependent oxygenase domain-containing protein [Tistlia consotensis]SMF36157.1 Isopenicillin N synthase [Tistlia consotensis USBA 355]SNR71540.1 Isopenicillin N synthase [Tistlia consotensis]